MGVHPRFGHDRRGSDVGNEEVELNVDTVTTRCRNVFREGGWRQLMNRAVSCAVAMLMVCAPLLAGNPFHNTDNTRWATRCNGPQGAIIIRDDRVVSVQAGMQAALASAAGADLVRAAHTVELLKRIGLASPRARAAFPRLVFHTRNNRLQLPDLASAQAQPASLGDPANDLTFVFENWDPSEEAALRDYLNVAYPKAKLIYGPPAFNITVKIIRDPSIQELQGGVYDATNNEIRMPGLTGNFPEDTFILMILVLHAFHDDVALLHFYPDDPGAARLP